MAAAPITLNGVWYPKGKGAGDQPEPGYFVGVAWNPNLSVGGGPVIPPDVAPQPPTPEHPIVLPPVTDPPPDLPPIGTQPDGDGFLKPPPPGGGWSFHKDYGWLYKPSGAGPKR